MSKTEIATGKVTEYTWDYRNRLTNVKVKDSQNAVIRETNYTYDPLDKRIGMSDDPDGQGQQPAVERWTVYDGSNPYADFDGSGNLTNRYLYGPAVDMILARESAEGDVAWHLTDHLGSVRDIADPDGDVIDHIVYSSFGGVLSESSPANGDRFKYTARELDPNGLYYYRARYYDAALGRFLSEDPKAFSAGDANLYRYCGNSPTNHVDPSGNDGSGGGDSGGGDDSLLGHPTWGPGNPYYDAMNSPPGILLNPGYWMPLFPSITVDWPHRITIIVPIFGTATPDLPAGGPPHVVPVKPGGPTVPKLPPWIRPIPGAPGHYGPVLLLPGKGGQIGIGVKPGVGLGPDGRPTFHPSISIGGEIKW